MLRKLVDVLQNANDLSEDDAVFIDSSVSAPYTADTNCAALPVPFVMLNEAGHTVNEEIPVFAIEHNLKYILSIIEVQDIVINAGEQKSVLEEKELLEAFNFYILNDAFVELDTD